MRERPGTDTAGGGGRRSAARADRRTTARCLVALFSAAALGACSGGVPTAPSEVSLDPTPPMFAVGEPARFVLVNASERTVVFSTCWDTRVLAWSGNGWRALPSRPAAFCVGPAFELAPGESSPPFGLHPTDLPEGFYRGSVLVALEGPLRSVTSAPFEVR